MFFYRFNTMHIMSIATLVLSLSGTNTFSQVVQFRLETTDASGNAVDTIQVGEEFHLNVYTQHLNGYVSEENSGVFAGYLDVTFDAQLASVAGDIEHARNYTNGKSGDTSTAGVLDDIGGFSSGGELGIGLEPLGLDEYHLLRVPFRAESVGMLQFTGNESNSYPTHDVLVYGLDQPVPAREIDFGVADARIDFGAANIQVVPEPACGILATVGLLAVLRSSRSNRKRI